MAEEPATINLSAILTLASVSPQFATAAAAFQSAYESMSSQADDFADVFDGDREEMESFLQDIKALASSADSISDEINDKINAELDKVVEANNE